MAKFKGFIKNCECCGKEFRVSRSQERVRTCSKECGYKIRAVVNKVEWVTCKCKNCGGEFRSPPSQATDRVYCSNECRFASTEYRADIASRVTGEANPMWKGGVTRYSVSASGKKYPRQQPSAEDAKVRKRKMAKGIATPIWARKWAIAEVYRTAKQLTTATGIAHHVDHIIPLQHPLVCGLHCESNLRIVSATDNIAKSNKFEV